MSRTRASSFDENAYKHLKELIQNTNEKKIFGIVDGNFFIFMNEEEDNLVNIIQLIKKIFYIGKQDSTKKIDVLEYNYDDKTNRENVYFRALNDWKRVNGYTYYDIYTEKGGTVAKEIKRNTLLPENAQQLLPKNIVSRYLIQRLLDAKNSFVQAEVEKELGVILGFAKTTTNSSISSGSSDANGSCSSGSSGSGCAIMGGRRKHHAKKTKRKQQKRNHTRKHK